MSGFDQEDYCKECGRWRKIVNKKYYLCQDCNWKRLHPNEKPKVYVFKQASIKGVSSKKAKAIIQRNRTYQEIDNNEERVCSGCGSGQWPLSHSHLIPVSKRVDLESCRENIVYDCLSIGEHKGCHDRWETHSVEEMMKLNDFWERLEKIERLDREYFNQLYIKVENYLEK